METEKGTLYSNEPESYEDTTDIRDERILAEWYTDWTKQPFKFFFAMSNDEAILLAFLINHSHLKKAYQKHQGWFYCKKSWVEDSIGMEPLLQQRLIRSLRLRGFLETDMRGCPPKQWFKLCLRRMERTHERIARKLETMKGNYKVIREYLRGIKARRVL